MKFLMLLIFVSCSFTRVINVETYSKKLADLQKKVASIKSKVTNDLLSKESLLREIRLALDQVKNKNLISKIKELVALEKKIILSVTNLSNLIEVFPYQNRNKLKEGTPAYDLVLTHKNNVEFLSQQIMSKNISITKVSSEINDLIMSKQIYRIDPKKMMEQISTAKSKTQKQLELIQKMLVKQQAIINKRIKLRPKFADIKLIFVKIKEQRLVLYNYLEKLNQTIIKTNQYWVAPGVFGHDYINKINIIVSNLKVLVNLYNEQVSHLNELARQR
jgi:DNA repair exonuclease SbcCD ATPase subunit